MTSGAQESTGSTGFGAAVVREEGAWRCSLLAHELLDDLDGVITALRRVDSSGAVFGLVMVDDEFFVIVRPVPGGAALLLSDATAALDYDIAADVLDLLHISVPEEDEIDDDPWPEGDLALLADLGVPRAGDAADCRRGRPLPRQQRNWHMIAQRCGFADQFSALLEKL